MEILEKEHAEILITDMMMPGKNGMELQAWIHARSLRTKVIVISGHGDFEFVRHTIKYGGQDYLLKPINPEKIRKDLSQAINSLATKARKHRSRPNLRIAQVAEMVGYQDGKYFSKVFKKTVGLSPNEFRKQQPEKYML